MHVGTRKILPGMVHWPAMHLALFAPQLPPSFAFLQTGGLTLVSHALHGWGQAGLQAAVPGQRQLELSVQLAARIRSGSALA